MLCTNAIDTNVCVQSFLVSVDEVHVPGRTGRDEYAARQHQCVLRPHHRRHVRRRRQRPLRRVELRRTSAAHANKHRAHWRHLANTMASDRFAASNFGVRLQHTQINTVHVGATWRIRWPATATTLLISFEHRSRIGETSST